MLIGLVRALALADLSQFGASDLVKPFRISERYPKVFTTALRGVHAAQGAQGAGNALMRGGGWEGRRMCR